MKTQKSPTQGRGQKSNQIQRQHYNTNDALDQFRSVVTIAGILLPDHLPTGEIIRCDVQGKKPGNKAASVCLHLDGWPAGWFENFTDGLGVRKWRYSPDGATPPPVDFDHKAHEVKLKAQRDRMAAARQSKKDQAAAKAKALYGNAGTPHHVYLTKKRIKPHIARQTGEALLVPLTNNKGELVNLQRIYPDGSKRFLPGGQIQACFCPLGRVTNPQAIIFICEGFATGATIHETTGHPVACAMNAGNLHPVAQAIREAYPQAKIVVAGDDDRQSEGNPGRTKAHEAAFNAKGMVTFPNFCRPDCTCTDFNDAACCRSRSGGDS
ncbi:MAG: toprim domain-containing protein [Pseudomonadota bacterium]|nr:toprim domain-containing protein [Pseudomonadota bacterium]